jgi:hypothetical protein
MMLSMNENGKNEMKNEIENIHIQMETFMNELLLMENLSEIERLHLKILELLLVENLKIINLSHEM